MSRRHEYDLICIGSGRWVNKLVLVCHATGAAVPAVVADVAVTVPDAAASVGS
jgi:hypothetical protein